MGYSFYLISKEKEITEKDVKLATSNLSKFNREGEFGISPCDVSFDERYITISGSFNMSGKHAEGMVLNMLIVFSEIGFNLKVLSSDWGYGSKEDWAWFESL